MFQSHVVEVDGTFVGAAIRQENGFRFVAVDIRMEELHDSVWPTLSQVQHLARQLLLTGRLGGDSRPRLGVPMAAE